MERVEVLLEKLRQQWQDKVPYAQLLITLQLLQEELRLLEGKDSSAPKTGKVSVIVPRGSSAMPVPTDPLPPVEKEEKIVAVLQVDEREIEAELKQIREAAERRNELARAVRPGSMEKDLPDDTDDIPTIASHLPYMPASGQPVMPAEDEQTQSRPLPVSKTEKTEGPLKDPSIADGSLNEKLRPSGKELADLLQGSPVRDLRKAIGINDRYLYINELFRGNEAMFDRALKTLNDFSILQEAEYWMQRELRIKLGWKDNDPAVEQFTQLVKRRFS